MPVGGQGETQWLTLVSKDLEGRDRPARGAAGQVRSPDPRPRGLIRPITPDPGCDFPPICYLLPI